MFTESKIIKQITIQPQSNTVNVQWANVVKKDDVVISETFERKAYDAALEGFTTEVGQLDVNAFLAAFNAATLDDKVEALAAKTAAEAALATAQAAHTAELAAKQTEMDAALASAQTTHAAELATAQAEIARLTALIPAPVIVDGVPQTVTMRQARLALLASGLLDDVTAAVAGAGEAAKIEWEYASDVSRNAILIQTLGGSLGLPGDYLDSLFVLAATL